MATRGFHSPFMGSVTATTTAQSIYSLLSAIWSDLPVSAQVVRIQLDQSAGSTILYVGNSNVTSTNCGASFNASQVQDLPSVSSNLYALKDIYLLAASGTVQVNLTILTR